MNVHSGLLPRRIALALKQFFLLVTFLLAGPGLHAAAVNSSVMAVPNWDKEMAIAAARTGADDTQVAAWLELAESGQANTLLLELKSSDSHGSPAFESQLFALAMALSEAPLEQDLSSLLGWLMNYPVEVLVAHEEHPDYGVALFPVQAAALGSSAQRKRLRAEQLSLHLLQASPEKWSSQYLAADALEREGFSAALQRTSRNSLQTLDQPDGGLQSLADSLQKNVSAYPELATPLGELAVSLGDPALFLSALELAPGERTAPLLRNAVLQLDDAQRAKLLFQALDNSRREPDPLTNQTAALSISILAPSLRSDEQVSHVLLALLDDEQLGAVAALALAGHPDQQVQAILQDLLQGGGITAKRAALALDTEPAGGGK